MMGPWEKYQQPDDPYQITQPLTPTQQLGNQGQSLQNQRLPIQTEGDVLSNARNAYELQNKPTYDRASAIDKARDGYRQDRRVLSFEAALPVAMSGLQSPEDAAGDNLLVNAIAKTTDPTTGVQAREGASWENAQPQLDQIKASLLKQFGTDGYGNFTPEGRTKIREALRVRLKVLATQYDQARGEYRQYIKGLGLPNVDPDTILGPHAYQPFQKVEEEYIRKHGGTPKINGVPVDQAPPLQTQTEGGFGLEQPKDVPGANDYRNALYGAMKGKQIRSYDDALRFTEQFNQAHGTQIAPPVKDKGFFNAVAASLKGKDFNVALPRYDQRTLQKVQEMERNAGRGTAAKAGVKDAVTVGLGDEIQGAVNAAGQSLRGEGSFSDLYGVNRDAARIYQDFQQQTHPGFYMAGQLAGSAALPAFGASTPAELARLGAAYGGAYGFDSGQGGFGDRLANGVEGAAAGGLTGYAIPKALSMIPRSAPKTVPPLVDPITGSLNQPLEAMTPAQRMAAAQQFGIDLPADAAGGRSAAVIGKGLDILPGSAGAMEDARRATEQQVAGAVDHVAGQFGSARTLNEAGAELQRGANERIARGETVTAKAYNAIPISDHAPASTSNAIATLQQLTGRFESNPDLANTMKDPKLSAYLNALQGGKLSWKDLKDFRSIIGEKIGDMRFGEGQSTSDLRALYAGLSEDMKTTAASQGSRAIHAFERANNLYRQEQQMINGALTRILGPDGQLAPERAAAAVQAMTKGGKSTGDLRTLAQIRAATVKSGAWDEIASTLIRLGGQPANSQGRDFNPQTFVQWYSDMAEPARAMLFKPELRKSLDQFTAVNQRLMKVNALRNTSNTGPGIMAGSTVAALGLAVANPLLGAKLLGGMAANYGMAKLWTSPKFVQWATGYSRSLGRPAAERSQLGRLAKLAATNPELREPLIDLQRHLIANDNFVPGLSANPNQEQNQQQPY